MITPLKWQDHTLSLLDQRRLPTEEVWIECHTDADVAVAIRDMIVRGAPAIGCTAAFGVALAARSAAKAPDLATFLRTVEAAIDGLAKTRPTAVNLFWALSEMRHMLYAGKSLPDERAHALEHRAIALWQDDIARCQRIGQAGAELIPDGATILTHCNAGALATGGYGTALGIVRAAHEAGKRVRVLADETRPYLQGARLTAWELHKDGIDVTVIPDVASAWMMRRGEVTLAIVGADRIARNGDVANKIGTYGVALAAREHGVPFYVAAPLSTVDLDTPDGESIPIEERSPDEVTRLGPTQLAPPGVSARNPAFDVTPARLVSALVTERGVARPPFAELALWK
jgi:methylthioribose-1-phosphate isomerase